MTMMNHEVQYYINILTSVVGSTAVSSQHVLFTHSSLNRDTDTRDDG